MLSTQDILASKSEIRTVWEIGMQRQTITRDKALQANIKSIAEEIMSKQEEIIPRLSGVLLYGISSLYNKKTFFVLEICTDVLSRINLKVITPTKDKKKKQPIIDDETLKLWENVNKLDFTKVPDDEQAELKFEQSEILSIPRPEENHEDDDLGEAFLDNTIPIEEDLPFEAPNFEEEHVLNVSPQIDPSPVRTFLDLNNDLDKPTLIERPNLPEISLNYKLDITEPFKDIFEQAAAIQVNYNQIELPVGEASDEPELPIHDFPDLFEEVEEEQIPENVFDDCELIIDPLRINDQISLTQSIPDNTSRLSVVRTFFTALSLCARGVIELNQTDENEEIIVYKGPNFK